MTKNAPRGIRKFLNTLGPGLITGAADDDPSGIGTHSQVGAEFGYGLAWTFVLSFPLMVAIQQIAAEIGRVTGAGIARNLRRHYPRPILYAMVSLLLVANIVNLHAASYCRCATIGSIALTAPGRDREAKCEKAISSEATLPVGYGHALG